ncbi:MAG TPA: RNA polymerase sigma factor [bacterium]|nr:RNA polymerase sigma factor [bacterium]
MAEQRGRYDSAAVEPPGGDAEILGQLRAGDEAGFLSLVERHGPAMLRLASVHLSRAVAEEAVQDTWVAVLQGLNRFEQRSSLKTWIFSILMNRVRTQAQREGRTRPFSSFDTGAAGEEPALPDERFFPADHPEWPHHWAAPPKDWGASPEDRLLSEEVRAEIHRAIDGLPAGQREVITLSDVEGWTADEVSGLLGITAVNQRVLLHRARSKVRHALERYFEEVD